MPKFLWRIVTEYLTCTDIDKMITVTKNFDQFLSDKGFKCWFHHISTSIVIVKCKTKVMDNFWKHACYNHISCNNFDNMLKLISDDNYVRSKHTHKEFIYYKVFINSGRYIYATEDGSRFIYNFTECSIEIIGCKDNKPIIYERPNTVDTMIICPQHFSIKNMIFDSNIDFFETLCMDDPHTVSYFHVSNCEFNGEYLHVCMIDNVHIVNCVFNSSHVSITETSRYNPLPLMVKYVISNNIFFNNMSFCTKIDGNKYDSKSTITISDNIAINSSILCKNSIEDQSILHITNNIIN